MEDKSVNEEQWNYYFIPYEQAISELVIKFRNLKKEYKKRKVHSPIEEVTGRVKTKNSVINKAKRYGITVDQEIGDKLKDIAGIRIISQFENDIDQVVEMIEMRCDMEIVEKKDYIHSPKKSGYRSYHLIISYQVITVDGPTVVYIEVQLRTMAMNFWATIEHTLQYKYDGKIPEHIQGRLNQAALASAKLDSEMYGIREEIIQAQLYYNLYREIQNLIKAIDTSDNSEIRELVYKANKYMNQTENIEKLEQIKDELESVSKDVNI